MSRRRYPARSTRRAWKCTKGHELVLERGASATDADWTAVVEDARRMMRRGCTATVDGRTCGADVVAQVRP